MTPEAQKAMRVPLDDWDKELLERPGYDPLLLGYDFHRLWLDDIVFATIDMYTYQIRVKHQVFQNAPGTITFKLRPDGSGYRIVDVIREYDR